MLGLTGVDHHSWSLRPIALFISFSFPSLGGWIYKLNLPAEVFFWMVSLFYCSEAGGVCLHTSAKWAESSVYGGFPVTHVRVVPIETD